MGNVLKMVKEKMVRELIKSGWSNRKISESTQIHRATIRRIRQKLQKEQAVESKTKSQEKGEAHLSGFDELGQNVPENGQNMCPPARVVHFEVPTGSEIVRASRSQAAQFAAVIQKKLENGQNAKSIFQDLYLECGYTGAYDSIKRYIQKLRKTDPRVYQRVETAPGEEAQVDFGQGAPTLKNGRYHRPWLFVMTLSHSRHHFSCVVWKQDVETFIRCHEAAFRFFGGVVKIVLLDNLKSGVLQAHLYDPVLNPNYANYSEHAGFVPLPCRVATPEHKGKVESGVNYIQESCLKGKNFDSLETQNARLLQFSQKIAFQRIHGTTKRQVQAMYEAELPELQAVPESDYPFFKIGVRKVSATDSHIEVNGAYYPVPPQYMGQKVTVHFNSQTVSVYSQERLIQQLGVIEKGRFHPDQRCLPHKTLYNRNEQQKKLLEKCHQGGTELGQWAEATIASRGLPGYKAIQGVLALQSTCTSILFSEALRIALERQAYSSKLVRHILLEQALRQDDQESAPKQLSQSSELIRSPREYGNLLSKETKQ
jgi:transposase